MPTTKPPQEGDEYAVESDAPVLVRGVYEDYQDDRFRVVRRGTGEEVRGRLTITAANAIASRMNGRDMTPSRKEDAPDWEPPTLCVVCGTPIGSAELCAGCAARHGNYFDHYGPVARGRLEPA